MIRNTVLILNANDGSTAGSFYYNILGTVVSDTTETSVRISDISYDRSCNPLRISYSDGSSTQNVYSATGEKLKSTHAVRLSTGSMAFSAVSYRGPAIYIDGRLYMVLFPGGYTSYDTGGVFTFHYYTPDYLGNNRAVINGSTGAIEQTVAYYPYGGVIPTLGNPTGGQPYKFGGKELMTANGLNEYDFGARQYWSSVPCFTRIDPMAEKYTWLSPYLYCANNPVNYVDRDGKETHLWTTILPGPVGKLYGAATHSFITVTTENNGKKVTSYYAYGSEADGFFNWISGQLGQCYYEQDIALIRGDISEKDIVKEKFLISPPEGMTQEEFDNKVKEVASSFGNQEKIRYCLDPSSSLEGNCNSSTYTILKKAGVSEEVLKDLEFKIQGKHWGWGLLKPWTKEEQIQAIEAYPKFDFEIKRYEILQNALP